jgi:hypothetical protein
LSSAADVPAWGVEGPVQAEVFVLRLHSGAPELAGPCGPDAWYIEMGQDDDPVEVVKRISTRLLGPPLLVHSTSWRRARGSVILTFIVVIADDQARQYPGLVIGRAQLARSAATDAPRSIATSQVIEHGLRHLSWLAREDEVVKAILNDDWKSVLAAYLPEPFQHI